MVSFVGTVCTVVPHIHAKDRTGRACLKSGIHPLKLPNANLSDPIGPNPRDPLSSRQSVSLPFLFIRFLFLLLHVRFAQFTLSFCMSLYLTPYTILRPNTFFVRIVFNNSIKFSSYREKTAVSAWANVVFRICSQEKGGFYPRKKTSDSNSAGKLRRAQTDCLKLFFFSFLGIFSPTCDRRMKLLLTHSWAVTGGCPSKEKKKDVFQLRGETFTSVLLLFVRFNSAFLRRTAWFKWGRFVERITKHCPVMCTRTQA